LSGIGLIVVLFFLGLATAIVGKIKGSSFLVWFVVGFCLPFAGLAAAILYRWERHEPRRQCPRCGAIVNLTNQICTRCGEDLDWPDSFPSSPPSR
jgi:hypothetical protein